ncbi:MAG: hypothetical protein HYV60_15145, partial [Planctomycetia bacterium]|nr:hypothetical protein [Planctomycetia bacterium]
SGMATGDGVDYTDPTTVTIPAGTYNAIAVDITGLSVTSDTFIESDETIDLGMLTGSQVQVGDANGDGTIQATTRYTIIDDEMPSTAVSPDSPTKLTIRDVVPGGKADRLDLTIVNGMLVITDLNNLVGDYFDNSTGSTVDVPLASILSIEIDLLDGDDQLSIDFSTAPPEFNMSVTINGGGGHDTLTFSGPTPLGSGDLTTNDEVDDIFVNAPITTQGGRVTLKAMRDLELNASIDTGTGGSVDLSANGHDIFGNCSLIQAGDADVHLTAGTGIAGGRVQTTGDVTLDAGSGGIAGCAGPLAVTARTLTVVANASVGAALLISGRVTNVEPLLTNVDTIEGVVGGLGMFLVNDGPLTDNVVLVDTAPLGIRDVRVLPPSDAPDGEGSPPQNAANRFDVNDDGAVSPVDALAVVNYLNSLASGVQAEGSSHPRVRLYVDVNGDREASALDALLVINYLNSRTASLAEGESMGAGCEHAAVHAGQVLSREAASSDAGLHEQPRRRASAELPNPGRSNDLFATPPSSLETSHSTSRHARTLLKDEHATSEFESLLATIAEDTAAAWFA